jgi:hypothetical protein
LCRCLAAGPGCCQQERADPLEGFVPHSFIL